jgi:four helix bundle protein
MAKHQIQNLKSQINLKSQNTNNRPYDLEARTLEFGKRIVRLCKALSKDVVNKRLADQLIRSGTSVGANYREANETETKKDFKNRIRIARMEAKETIYWINLVIEANRDLEKQIEPLLQEATELLKILAAISEKSK